MSPARSWQLNHPEALTLRAWPDGCVLYDARTATTQLLSHEASAVVGALKEGPLGSSRLSAILDGAPEADVERLLDTLAHHGIVLAHD